MPSRLRRVLLRLAIVAAAPRARVHRVPARLHRFQAHPRRARPSPRVLAPALVVLAVGFALVPQGATIRATPPSEWSPQPATAFRPFPGVAKDPAAESPSATVTAGDLGADVPSAGVGSTPAAGAGPTPAAGAGGPTSGARGPDAADAISDHEGVPGPVPIDIVELGASPAAVPAPPTATAATATQATATAATATPATATQAAAAAEARPPKGPVHVVRAGDNLWTIARRHDAELAGILRWNEVDPDRLVAGQRILVPGGSKMAPLPRPQAAAPRPASVQPARSRQAAAPRVADGSHLWPLPLRGTITTRFSGAHPGIDIAAPAGTPVRAIAGGTITWAGWRNNGGGYVVIVRHPDGMTSEYNHNSKVTVAKGDQVGQGDTIALVGSTGNSTGPHLDLRIEMGGRLVDPLDIY